MSSDGPRPAGDPNMLLGAEDLLPAEVHMLLQSLGMQVVAVQEMTRLTSPIQRKRSMRIDLRDGRRIKVRLFPDSRRVQRILSLFPLLEDMPFSRILAHSGRATLEAWVEGVPLEARSVSTAIAHRAGGILGRLHTRRGYADTHCEGMPDVSFYLDRLGRHLAILRQHGAASDQFCRQLEQLARDHVPASLDSGVIHADFCADNMIATPSGELFIVDNEDMRVGILDFDLARCWSRWPMTPAQRAAFLDGYGRYRSPATFMAHSRFWGVVALVMSLHVFLRHGRSRPALQAALVRLAGTDGGDFWPRP